MNAKIHVSAIAMVLLGVSAASVRADVYSDKVLLLNPTRYFRLDETNVSPTNPATNLATSGTSFNAVYSTSGGGSTVSTGTSGGAVPGNAGVSTTGFAVNLQANGTGVTGMASGSTSFSVSLWVNPTSFGVNDFGTPFSYGQNIGRSIIIAENGSAGNGSLTIGRFGSNIITSSGLMTANAWNHIGLTYDGSTMRLYLNGVADNTWTGTLTSDNTFAWLGGLFSGGQPFAGKLDEFAYWNGTALTAPQMQSLAVVVPEPGVNVLLAAGLGAWCLARCRRGFGGQRGITRQRSPAA